MTRVTKVSPKLMEHWVARKPTSTPTLRAGSIAMYVRFCKMFFPDNHIFFSLMKRWPIDTWTRAQAFVASLSFVAELLG